MKSNSSAYKEFQQFMKNNQGRNYLQCKDQEAINSIIVSQSSITSKIILNQMKNVRLRKINSQI